MTLVLISCGLIGLLVLLWRMTVHHPVPDDKRIDRMMSMIQTEMPEARSEVNADVLIEMLKRMGLDGRDAIAAAGFSMPPDTDPVWPVVQSTDELQGVLAEAIMVGVQVARVDDDYAGVGDGALSDEARVNQAEIVLFGDDRRERHTLYG